MEKVFVRADTTEYNAGTLPLNLYDNNPLPSCSTIEFSQQQPEQNTNNTETPELQDSRFPLYLVGDYLAVMWEASICIARIITTVSDKSSTCSAISTLYRVHLFTPLPVKKMCQ